MDVRDEDVVAVLVEMAVLVELRANEEVDDGQPCGHDGEAAEAYEYGGAVVNPPQLVGEIPDHHPLGPL